MGSFSLTLLHDDASPCKAGNLVLVSQVAAGLLQYGAAISSKALNSRLVQLKGLRQARLTCPLALGELKALGVVKPQATSVRVASCPAVCRALRRFHCSFAPIAELVRQLSTVRRDAVRTAAGPRPQHLAAAAAAESRGPIHLRRNSVVAHPPAADDPLPQPASQPASRPGTATGTADMAAEAPAEQPPAETRTGPTPAQHAPAAAAAPPQRVPAVPAVGSTGGAYGPSAGPARRDEERWFYPFNSLRTLPRTLPNLPWPQSTKRYGLLTVMNPLRNDVPLKSELPAFEAWCKKPLDFGGSSVLIGVNDATYRCIENTVSKFLGFCFRHDGVPTPYLSLALFSNPVRLERQGGGPELKRH